MNKPTIAELEAIMAEPNVKVEILPNGQPVVGKTLIATVGLPKSGKTTWAKNQSAPIVNPDSIRLALHGQRFYADAEPFIWAIAKTMVRSLFLAGHNVVILDACNNTRKRRDEWKSKDWETAFKVIDAPDYTCVDRATAADDEYIIETITRMSAEHEPLGDNENAL